MLVEDFKKTLIKAVSVAIVILTVLSVGFLVQKSPIPQNGTFDRFLIGTGAGSLANLESLNSNYSLNMNLMTNWISGRDELYGWWSSYYSPEPFWAHGFVPHLITYQYFQDTWNVDYSAANLSLHRQDWLDDLRFMANRLKAPNDGNHTVLISLETEFNCYKNIDFTYWNQLMIDSRNAIKEVAPNVLMSYCIGGWEWRFNDVSMNGTLTSSMRSMDFMSFQAMWGARGEEETKWLGGDDLRKTYGAVNWVGKFGDKPHVWDYMIDDIAANVEALGKYNPHILLAHFSIDDYLWGPQAQADVVNELSQRVGSLKESGLFGVSWMGYIDNSEVGGDGFLLADGSGKPCLPPWVALVNKLS